METYATIVYVIADEVLRILQVFDDPQSKMSNAEVITFAIVAGKFFPAGKRSQNYLFANHPFNRKFEAME